MKRGRQIRHAAVAFGALSVFGAAPAGAETLFQALAHAYQNNPVILASRDQLRVVDEQIAQAISLLRPTLTLNVSTGYDTLTTRINNVTRTGDRSGLTSTSLVLSQPIYRGGREYAEIRRADATIRAQRARLHNTEQDVFFQVVTAYNNVLRDEAIVRLRTNNVGVLNRQLQAVRDRFNVGEVTRTDVAQAEAAVAGADAQRVLAIGNLESSRANYTNLVGHPPTRLVLPNTPAFLPAQFGLALNSAKDANPTIVAATFDEYAARHSVRSVIGELLPQVSVNGTLSRSYDSTTPSTFINRAQVTLKLTVPL